MGEFMTNPFMHVEGEQNDIEKAQLKANRKEKEDKKKKRTRNSLIAAAGLTAATVILPSALKAGAKEVQSSQNKETPAKTASVFPETRTTYGENMSQAMDKTAKDAEVSQAGGGSAELPDYDKIGADLRENDPE
jgi:hypothetical protein